MKAKWRYQDEKLGIIKKIGDRRNLALALEWVNALVRRWESGFLGLPRPVRPHLWRYQFPVSRRYVRAAGSTDFVLAPPRDLTCTFSKFCNWFR